MNTTGLVRVTVAAPARRIDLALPDRAPVADLLPGLLRRAAPTDTTPDAGWVLRRPDGAPIEPAATLAAQHVRDGEVLHLVPGSLVWPELEYDDLVDAIAGAAGRAGRLWGPRHTRIAGLAAAAPAVGLILVAVARAGAGPAALLVAAALLAGGTLLARTGGDSGAGAVLAGLALPAAFLGGELTIGVPILGGCAAVLVAATAGVIGVADRVPVFVAAAVAALLCGPAAAFVLIGLATPAGAAAAAASVVFLFSPLLGPLAARLGRLPAPTLPRTAADLVRDDPQPARSAVEQAVIRSDALLTGMLWGGALTASVAALLLATGRGVSTVILLAVLALGYGVRARLYPAVRHRLPLLIAAVTIAVALAATWRAIHPPEFAVPILLALVALAVAAGLTYSRRPPGAALGRYAEHFETVLVLACVPVLCAVLQLFGLVRGLAG
ncbi:type VII secretion integral membrane protein EccD [Actinoplanes sp. NPDC051470]|uniref:type VII secretion integral membrane protein EccD n=1 Tax=Actinoplanes sp. NPDC051470 TaxID=3157224 RepID=UPI00343090CA